jgi:glycosyltransferase involved in cell wall biosynthesis
MSEAFWRVFDHYGRTRWIRDLRCWAPDLIYVNSVAALPILQMVSLPDVPSIVHVHELRSVLCAMMEKCPDLLVRRPSRYLAVSEAVRQALVSECGVDKDRIAVIHEFVPERRIDDASSHQAGRPDETTLVVGGAGIPSWRKGPKLWLQMVTEVRRLVGPTARFVWVGVPGRSGPCWREGKDFRREVSLMGLDGVVELIPPTTRPLEHFARFDVFAMTSLEDPCPLVVLETMGLGTPAVCFAGGGGSPEVVADTGVIIPDFDPLAMARAIADLAADPQKRARLGALARQRVLANFTDRVQVPKVRRELELLLDQPSVASHEAGS